MTNKGFESFRLRRGFYLATIQPRCSFSVIKMRAFTQSSNKGSRHWICQATCRYTVVLDLFLVCKENHDLEVSALREELYQAFSLCQTSSHLIWQKLSAIDPKRNQKSEDMQVAAVSLWFRQVCGDMGGNRLSKEWAVDVYFDGAKISKYWIAMLASNNTEQVVHLLPVLPVSCF